MKRLTERGGRHRTVGKVDESGSIIYNTEVGIACVEIGQ